MMKTWRILCGLMFFLSCNSAGPTLFLKSNLTGKQKSIIIKNTGDKDLIVENFTTTCDCTLIKLKKGEKVKPNDSLIVSVVVEKPDSSTAAKMVYISIRTNTTPAISTLSFVN
jgi:hypothetical protein